MNYYPILSLNSIYNNIFELVFKSKNLKKAQKEVVGIIRVNAKPTKTDILKKYFIKLLTTNLEKLKKTLMIYQLFIQSCKVTV